MKRWFRCLAFSGRQLIQLLLYVLHFAGYLVNERLRLGPLALQHGQPRLQGFHSNFRGEAIRARGHAGRGAGAPREGLRKSGRRPFTRQSCRVRRNPRLLTHVLNKILDYSRVGPIDKKKQEGHREREEGGDQFWNPAAWGAPGSWIPKIKISKRVV